MSTIHLNGSDLQVTGAGPITSAFDYDMVDALLRLPATGFRSIHSILLSLSPNARGSLDRVLDRSPDLVARVDAIRLSNPFLFDRAEPKSRLEAADILDSILVDCAPIMMVYFATDGTRYVSSYIANLTNVLTFDEFEAKYKRSVLEHLQHASQVHIDNLNRAMQLAASSPTAYDVQLSDDCAVSPPIRLVSYSEDQLAIYANRNGKTIMHKDRVS